jgi:hypothetical protein
VLTKRVDFSAAAAYLQCPCAGPPAQARQMRLLPLNPGTRLARYFGLPATSADRAAGLAGGLPRGFRGAGHACPARSPGRPGPPPRLRPPPAILIFWHHASAARRTRPRARATLQSEAEGAWCDRLSSDPLWRGLSQLDCAKIGGQKQAGQAFMIRDVSYLSASRAGPPGRPENPEASYAPTANGRLVVSRQVLSLRAQPATLALRSNRGRALHRRGYPVIIPITVPDAFLRLPPRHRHWCYPARARDRSRDGTPPTLRDQEGRQVQGSGDDLAALWGNARCPPSTIRSIGVIAQRRRAPGQTKQRRTDDPSEGCLASRISMSVWPSGSSSAHGSDLGASPGFKSDCRANAGGLAGLLFQTARRRSDIFTEARG